MKHAALSDLKMHQCQFKYFPFLRNKKSNETRGTAMARVNFEKRQEILLILQSSMMHTLLCSGQYLIILISLRAENWILLIDSFDCFLIGFIDSAVKVDHL